MAPTDDDDDAFLDLFDCGICGDYFFEPVTQACCGMTYCRRCLRQWIKSSVRSTSTARCPGGCNQKMSLKLPPSSDTLKSAMAKLVPEQLERRKREDLEEEEEEEEKICHGGFVPWQAVVASQDIFLFSGVMGVRQGTPGVVVSNSSHVRHLIVKFDVREDGLDLCIDVLPEHLMIPLPGGFRLAQKVMASSDLYVNGMVVVRVGSAGIILGSGPGAADHLHVLFEERLDGNVGHIAVHNSTLFPHRLLAGGFKLGQRVLSNGDLVVNGQVLVPKHTPGKVVAEYNEMRLTVAFDIGGTNQSHEGQGSPCVFNVVPAEIRGLCDSPCDIHGGDMVRAKCDLYIEPCNVQVVAGTCGLVHSYIDEKKIIVAFQGRAGVPDFLSVSSNCIEKVTETPIQEPVKTLHEYVGLVASASPTDLEVVLLALKPENRERLAQLCRNMMS